MASSLRSVDDLRQAIGTTLGPSRWVTIDQGQIDAFAEVTGDHQWIHVDRERAAQGKFGRTIAHGYLTLSLAPMLMGELTDLRQGATSINYGLNRLRFLTPVPVDSRVRLHAKVVRIEDRPQGGVLVAYELRFELEGSERPALLAETLSLLLPQGGQEVAD
ncbi:MAG: MaoC family dehydratase [Candidatus Dormibacteria bacterium]